MILLVGAASIGKGPAIDPVEYLLRKLDTTHDVLHSAEGIHLGPGDCTVAGLFDEYIDDGAQKLYEFEGKKVSFSSVILIAEELSTLMHNVDLQMMGYLINFLNCHTHSQRLRGKGETQTIDRPVLHVLGGVQPKMLSQIFPEQAFGMGLTARTTFVYSKDKIKVSPFRIEKIDQKLEQQLLSDLRRVYSLTGTFKIHEDARDRIEEWWMHESDLDLQNHPKLVGYNGKRILHLFRLCMVHSAARADHMIIELCDVENSLLDLLEVEKDMPRIFQEMSGDSSSEDIIADIVHQVQVEYKKTGKPIPHHILTRFVGKKVKAYEIPTIIETLVNQEYIVQTKLVLALPGGGPKAYKPKDLH